MVTQKVG